MREQEVKEFVRFTMLEHLLGAEGEGSWTAKEMRESSYDGQGCKEGEKQER